MNTQVESVPDGEEAMFVRRISCISDAYRKKCAECIAVRKENDGLRKELAKLKEPDTKVLKTWNDYILHICKDGNQRTTREIFDEIRSMDSQPWSPEAKTPEATCSSVCGQLFKNSILCKTNDTPLKYFILLK